MKIYLVDDYEIFTYSLPNKIEDAFVINYVHYSGKEESITFMAEDNMWVIQSSSEIHFQNDYGEVAKEALQNDSIYTVQFSDLTDFVTLYCFDAHQEFYDYDIIDRNRLTVGRAGNLDILYDLL